MINRFSTSTPKGSNSLTLSLWNVILSAHTKGDNRTNAVLKAATEKNTTVVTPKEGQ